MRRFAAILPLVTLVACDVLSEQLESLELGDVTDFLEPPEDYQLFPLFMDGPESWNAGSADTGVQDTGMRDTDVHDTSREDTGVEDTGVLRDCDRHGVSLTLSPDSIEEGASWEVEGAVLTLLPFDGEYSADVPLPDVLALAPGTLAIDLARLECRPTSVVVETNVWCDVGCTTLTSCHALAKLELTRVALS